MLGCHTACITAELSHLPLKLHLVLGVAKLSFTSMRTIECLYFHLNLVDVKGGFASCYEIGHIKTYAVWSIALAQSICTTSAVIGRRS